MPAAGLRSFYGVLATRSIVRFTALCFHMDYFFYLGARAADNVGSLTNGALLHGGMRAL
jgi:hypothetical protein